MAKFTGHTITSDSALGTAKIQRSLRFNHSDDAYFNRTNGTSTSQYKWTFSAWIKLSRGAEATSDYGELISGHTGNGSDDNFGAVYFYSGVLRFAGWGTGWRHTSRVFRDSSAWMHVMVAVDTTNGTASNRVKMYVNGVEETYFGTSNNPSQNATVGINQNSATIQVGRDNTNSSDRRFDGYMAEVNFIDGQQLDASYFGFTDPVTNIWMPRRYEGTYGNNGFYLDFSDNSSTAALGIDKSPNGNDFTANNFSVSDSVKDTPTNAFATLNSTIASPDVTFKEGSLYFDTPDTHKSSYANIAVNSGKWYWEAKAIAGSTVKWTYGVSDVMNVSGKQVTGRNYLLAHTSDDSGGTYANGDAVSIYYGDLRKNGSITGSSVQTNIAQGDIIGIALDVDAGKVWFARNGTWVNGSASASTTLNLANHDTTVTTGETYVPAFSGESADWQANFGQDDSFSGTSTSQGNKDENGFGSFYYAVPSGFKALYTKNLPKTVPSIVKPQRHFGILSYTGNGSGQTISGLEFKPDFLWIKSRTSSEPHELNDTVRGTLKSLSSNLQTVENTASGRVTSFNDGGYTVGNSGNVNSNGESFIAMCWKGGGAAVSNSDGSITSSVSANQEAGFSIVTWTGNATAGATIGHGLGKAPACIFLKGRDFEDHWAVYHKRIGTSLSDSNRKLLKLNEGASYQTSTSYWNDTSPTSSVFSLGTDQRTNKNTGTFVAYCWAEIPGYSKFGTYTGNGNSNGSYVHLGFRPAFVIFKSSETGENWQMKDNKRVGYNDQNHTLFPNNENTEYTTAQMDFLSDGFKLRNGGGGSNGTDEKLVYMAWAEQPGVTPFDTVSNAR